MYKNFNLILDNGFYITDFIQAQGEAIGQARGEAIGQTRGEAIGWTRGEENTKRMVATNLMKMQIPVEKIAQVLETTVENVERLLEKQV